MLLIDAYNLVHALGKSAGTGVNLGGLVSLLDAAGTRVSGGQRVVLVCDGTGRGGGVGDEYTRADAQIRVVFAGPGKDADSALERMLEEWCHFHGGRADRVTVVSSDKRVQAAALGCHAGRISSERFAAGLVEGVRRARGGQELGAARPESVDSDEAALWLKEFGVGDQGREPKTAAGDQRTTQKSAEDERTTRENVAREEWPDGIDPADLDMRTWLEE
ncbi:MAG: NYN domain-containing protein [Phycisphaerales bacterium]|nr:NYN domain-containing protein [Phycisphaerales bacterium]